MIRIIQLFLLNFLCIASAFAQSEVSDSVVHENRCDCLKEVYLFKKEFIKSFSVSEARVNLSPEFIKKHDFTWEKLQHIDSNCKDVKQNGDGSSCPYEEKIAALSDDFELIIRVIKMNTRSDGH